MSHRLKAILVMLALLLSFERGVAQERRNDLLIYKIGFYADPQPMILYDPIAKTHTSLLDGMAVGAFSFGPTGMLAFTAQHEGDSEVYVWDVRAPNDPPVNISRNSERQDYPVSWSPDGSLLALISEYGPGDKYIAVWDGETVVNITPTDFYVGDDATVEWSTDGRIAFTAYVGYPYLISNGLYIWDGETVFPFSRPPRRLYGSPAWSDDGRLAVTSNKVIYVWDGMSFKEGMPDESTLMKVDTAVSVSIYSHIGWTSSGQLTFSGRGAKDTGDQIYVWDGRTASDMSRISDANINSGSAVWSADGRWAFVNFFSPEQFLYVRDARNQTLLKVEAQYPPAWSRNGFLMYCAPGWTLSLWDGERIDEIVKANDIQAQWQGGEQITCSFG